MKGLLLTFLATLTLTFLSRAQQSEKHDPFKILEEQNLETSKEKGKDKFDHWSYFEKDHATFLYYAPMIVQGIGPNQYPTNVNHDAGVMHRSFLVKGNPYRLNAHVWAEYNGFVAGRKMKEFTQDMQMFSPANDGFSEGHEVFIKNFYLENLFVDGLIDVTIGKMDPVFITTITSYSGWDRYNYFSKSAASDPVPDMNEGMGLCLYLNPTDQLSFGFLATDADAENNYLYIPEFSANRFNYQAAVNWKIGRKRFSEHNFMAYHQPEFINRTGGLLKEGNGFVYNANQELWENAILILKLSNGSGRIDKLNGAYVTGLTFKSPLNRIGDQAGFALIVNEKLPYFEYGADLYWRFYLFEWINVAANVQSYYTLFDRVNWVMGARVFIGY